MVIRLILSWTNIALGSYSLIFFPVFGMFGPAPLRLLLFGLVMPILLILAGIKMRRGNNTGWYISFTAFVLYLCGSLYSATLFIYRDGFNLFELSLFFIPPNNTVIIVALLSIEIIVFLLKKDVPNNNASVVK